jgi:predicted unusual protein kinase regulating ubiquinone biosynthesis (AarF/ABC1/UbiB family)
VTDNSIHQMRRYDPQAIARYYRYRPWRALWRSLVVIWLFLGFILGLKWDEWTQQAERNKGKRAIQLRQLLTRLGPTYFLEELTKLQDRLPPFSSQIAFAIIEREIDRSIDEVYSEISPAPIAAASLGQVYQARLRTGEEVAVKVQRPNLLPILTLDLYLMRWAASWLEPWLPVNLGGDLTSVVDEFGTKLFEEIDYLNEGRNAEKFAANFLNDPTVKVPAIYWRFSSRYVLTLEWINGFKLTDLNKVHESNLSESRLIEIGVTAGLKQLLEYGFFHADPHPGNLFAMPNGQMAYIDFGMMDQLTEEMKESLVDALVHLVNQDYEALALDFVSLGFLTPDTDIRPIIPALESVFTSVLSGSMRDFNFASITDQFASLVYKYPFRLPAKFALIIRSLITQEGIALGLDPSFKIIDVAYPYIARRLLTGESAQLRRRLIEVLFKDGKFQWERLENLIAIARSDTNFDLLPTAQLGIQYLMSEEGQYLRQLLISALVEDDRLHTEEVQRLWNLIKDDIKPARLFNVALGALSNFSSTNAAMLLPTIPAFKGRDW